MRNAIGLIVVLVGCVVLFDGRASADSASPEGDWAAMKGFTPRHYICYRATGPIKIDGKADEPAWANAPWTEDFVDIQGSVKPAPRFRTRAKLLWDDSYLYVFAELEEPHVWGTLTKKNSIMFMDPDFEVFIDPDGDNHNYYEYEMNALNSIWELTLDRPYRDGGPAHLGTNLKDLHSAVHIDGTINNPADTDRGWSVEIAFPWSGLKRYAGAATCPPKDGDQWRMGFSRVEWLVDIINGKYSKVPREAHPEDNWVWSPQGVIDMHRPERWGYVQFSNGAPGSAKFHPDVTLPLRDRLMEVYYRQKEYFKTHRHYADSAADLGMNQGNPVDIKKQGDGYLTTVRDPKTSIEMHLTADSKLSKGPVSK